jgi:hypothetical protein
MIGYIYCFSNESMPGIFKIGKTSRSPNDRASELYTTGVPTAFNEEISKKVDNYDEKEKIIHKLLDEYRIDSKREFFKVSFDKVKLIFDLMDEISNNTEIVSKEKSIEESINKIKFETIKEYKHDDIINQFVYYSTNTPTFIAKIMYFLYAPRYRIHLNKKKKEWYMLSIEGSWKSIDNCILRNKMLNEIPEIINNAVRKLKETAERNSDGEYGYLTLCRLKELYALEKSVSNSSFKDKVMKECENIFYIQESKIIEMPSKQNIFKKFCDARLRRGSEDKITLFDTIWNSYNMWNESNKIPLVLSKEELRTHLIDEFGEPRNDTFYKLIYFDSNNDIIRWDSLSQSKQ